jgi:hypothetical protein
MDAAGRPGPRSRAEVDRLRAVAADLVEQLAVHRARQATARERRAPPPRLRKLAAPDWPRTEP